MHSLVAGFLRSLRRVQPVNEDFLDPRETEVAAIELAQGSGINMRSEAQCMCVYMDLW